MLSKTFFGREISIPALWFVPLNDPMKMLICSMIFGVIHLFLGLGIKGYMYPKNKDTLGFVCDVVLWYMMLIGLMLILLPTELFGPSRRYRSYSRPLSSMLAKWMAIIGAVGILCYVGQNHEEPGARSRSALMICTTYRLAVRRAFLLPSAGAWTGDRRYRLRSEPDGQHVRRRHRRSCFIHRHFLLRPSVQPGNQPAGRVCPYMPSPVRGIFR